MKNVFSWVSFITGVLPGMAVILNGFGTPEALRRPFGIVAAVCGFVGFGLVALIKENVRREDRKQIAAGIVIFGLIGLVSLCAYWVVLDQCVFNSPDRSPVFYPLWLTGRAKEAVEEAGGRKSFYEMYGAGAVSALLRSQSGELSRTKGLLLMLILVASVALPVASGLASAYLDRRSPGGGASRRSKSRGLGKTARKDASRRASAKGDQRSVCTESIVGAYGLPCELMMKWPAKLTAW